MPTDREPALEQVLRHERGLRRLAAALLADPADSDDAVQHALAQAALGRRRPGTPLWPFLRTVLRRHASNLRKLAARRRAHEQRAARAEAVPSAAEFAARDQLRRHVADAVQALNEPYRTTVWLRWFEELDCDAVAVRLQVPVATVRTRLQRAHARLAARLDREYGDRRLWAVLALPLAHGATTAAITAIGSGLAMKKILALAIVLLPLALGYALWPAPGETAQATAAPASPPRAVAADLPAGATDRRELAAAPPAVPAPQLAVQFADGSPAAGLPVWFWRDDDSRPSWTQRVDAAVDREVGTGIVNAGEDPRPPAHAAATDAQGRVALPADPAQAAIVSVQYAPDQEFSAALPAAGKPLLLPALADLEIGVRSAPPGSKWSVLLSGGLREPDGGSSLYGDLRENVAAASGPGVVRIREHRYDLDVADRLHAWLPRDHLCGVDVWGHGFDLRLIDHSDNNAIVTVPAALEAESTRRLAGLELTVLEARGGRTSVTGHCSLVDRRTTELGPGLSSGGTEHQQELAAGTATFDEVELRQDATYTLVVLLADGEWFRREVRFAPVDGMHQVALTRGEGNQPVRLRLPGLAISSVHGVAIEYPDGTIHGAEPWAMHVMADDPVFASRGDQLALSLLPDAWLTAWVVLADGRLGMVGTLSSGEVADVHWLPALASETIDVATLYRDYGDHEMMAAYLEVELVGSRDVKSWFIVASHRRFHRSERVAPPVWRDLQLPAGSRSRIRLYGHEEPDGPGESHELPLPRR